LRQDRLPDMTGDGRYPCTGTPATAIYCRPWARWLSTLWIPL
jgi:hypothetical protein